ncbi:MAG: hypothetical protein ABW185_11985 [Sedimenticola sp.]
MLRTVIDDDQKDWDKKLPKILLAYRSSVHSTTKFTPHYLMFGREVQLPVDVMFGGVGERFKSPNQYAEKTKAQLDEAFQIARSNNKNSLRQQKKPYDKKIHGSPFLEGDTVMVYCPAFKQGLSKKFHRCWNGPWSIINKFSDAVYRVRKVGARRTMVVHFNRLRKFDTFPNQDATQKSLQETENLIENRQNDGPSQRQIHPAGDQSDNLGPGILVGLPSRMADPDNDHTNTSSSDEDSDDHTDHNRPPESSAISDPDNELNSNTWGAHKTRSGRRTVRPARLRDFVV